MSERSDATPDTPQRLQLPRGWLRGVLARIDATLPWRLLLLAAVLGMLLHLLGVLSLPFWPFTTAGGSIHVDSPEVYTRERLVNDRYEQDYWLREQLRLLNQVTPGDLAAGRLFTATRLDIGAAPGAGTDKGQPAAERAADQLDFRARYEVLSGIRDMLRQQVLENMLDDRHDLTANSVYGLKFDTTVIPGHNTRNRAFVEVELKPVDLFLPQQDRDSQDIAAGPLRGLNQFQRAYLCKQALLSRRDLAGCEGLDQALADYEDQHDLYQAWLQDIEKRLNAAEQSLYKVIAAKEPACAPVPAGIVRERYAELIGRSLEVVLNLPQKRFIIDHHGRLELAAPPLSGSAAEGDEAGGKGAGGDEAGDEGTGGRGARTGADVGPAPVGHQIRLPEPYSDYLQVTATPIWMPNAAKCNLRVALDVEPVRERYIARRARGDADGAGMATTPRLGVKVADLELVSSAPLDLLADMMLLGQSLSGALDVRALPCDASLAPLWTTADGGWRLLMDQATWQLRKSVASDFGVVYPVPGKLLDAMVRAGLTAAAFPHDCPHRRLEQYQVDLPSGFFNFIDSMRDLDAYAYAVFPKNDVRGTLRELRSGAGAAGAGGSLGFLRRLAESRTEPLLVGYGDARDAGDAAEPADDPRSVRFGWVIASPDKLAPSLKTQLALVSVPAWTNQLTVEVTTGWLDRTGNRRGVREKVPMTVKLPPDYGAFDSIFRDRGWVTPAPQIRDEEMDQAIYVVAGQEASILIPGLRLWRSTSVTLGAQPADRIRVLPNMEGIVAEFRPVRLPFAKYKPKPAAAGTGDVQAALSTPHRLPRCTLAEELPDGSSGEIPAAFEGLEVRPVRLRVWTSEGVAMAAQHACVVYDPRRQVREAMARPGMDAWAIDTSAEPMPPGGSESVPVTTLPPEEEGPNGGP